jgi:hypothetical protein
VAVMRVATSERIEIVWPLAIVLRPAPIPLKPGRRVGVSLTEGVRIPGHFGPFIFAHDRRSDTPSPHVAACYTLSGHR